MNDDKELQDLCYEIQLTAMELFIDDCEEDDEYEIIPYAKQIYYQLGKQYIDFRLKEFDSEGRMVVAEVYKILNYNPSNPHENKRIGRPN